MKTWITALNNYLYPVSLGSYEHSNLFPNYFNKEIKGDRNSTIRFENYFRENAQKSIEVYFEVIFWKLYSRKRDRQRITTRIIMHMLKEKIKPELLYNAIKRFVNTPNINNLHGIRCLLGIKTNVLALALTFPAFLNPERYPMVDKNVAQWVNANFTKHNTNRHARLTRFVLGYTSLRDNDFQNYLNWVNWCNETAKILSNRSNIKWRARDVEMAVFTAKRKNLELNVL